MSDGLGSTSSGAGQPQDPRSAWRMFQPAVLVGLLSGLAYGIATRLLMEANRLGALFGVMSLSFMVLVPMVIGYLTVRPHASPSWGYRLLAPWLSTVLSVVVCFAVGWEGTICIVMGLPLLLIFSSLGGVIAAITSKRGSGAAAAAMLVPVLAAPMEQRVPGPDSIHEVRTSIAIRATPGRRLGRDHRGPDHHG